VVGGRPWGKEPARACTAIIIERLSPRASDARDDRRGRRPHRVTARGLHGRPRVADADPDGDRRRNAGPDGAFDPDGQPDPDGDARPDYAGDAAGQPDRTTHPDRDGHS
jgi:hypothetical protein